MSSKIYHVVTDLNTAINNMRVPVGSLGIPRVLMPQIDNKDIDQFLKDVGEDNYTKVDVRVKDLHLTQNDVNKIKVYKMMRLYRRGIFPGPVIITNDRYVLDGSHRFIGKLNAFPLGKIKAIALDMNVRQALEFMRRLPYVKHRNMADRRVAK